MKTIIENNTLISVFMGGKTAIIHHNQYHSSWNELMPVVEKIEKDTSYRVEIAFSGCIIDKENEPNCIGELENTKIKSTYKAVVEFIKWYNENNN